MKIYFYKTKYNLIFLIIFLVSLSSFKANFLSAEYLLKDSQIDASTKTEKDSSAIPTNPFEIVEMMRKYNSLNDATNPSDAIDDALESFYSLEE